MALTIFEGKALNICREEFEETEAELLPLISKELAISINQVKGVVGSLAKKGLIIFGEVNGEKTIIYNGEVEL